MAKQQSMKQQIYQSIANSAVQQVMGQQREQGLAQLQADYDAWNTQQQEIAALQAEYDNWFKAQQPAQPIKQATVNEVKAETIPVLKSNADYRTERRDLALAKKRREDYQKNQQLEQIMAEQPYTDRGNEKWNKSVNDVVAGLNSKQNRDNLALAALQENEQGLPMTITQKVDKWLSPDYKLTDEERKEAKKLAQTELQKFAYDSNKKPVNLKTQEDKERYAKMVNLLNKSNPFTNTMAGYTRLLTNLGLGVRDAGSDVIDQLTGLGAAIGDKTGLTEGATKRHNEKVAEREAARQLTKDMMNNAYQNAKTQNPKLTGAGELAGQVSMYALTNPLFDSLGAAAGLGKAGSFALNQVGQNAQDLALDTIPKLNEYREGGLTDAEKRELIQGIGLNAAGNLALGAAGEGISALAKNRAAKKAADAAFRSNVSEGAEKLAKLADLEDVDNVVRNATKQAEEAAQNIDNIAKQMPEGYRPSEDELKGLIETVNPENEIEALNKEMSNMWADNAAETVENAAKSQQNGLARPETLTPELKAEVDNTSTFLVDYVDDLLTRAKNSGDETLIGKADQLFEKMDNYVNVIAKSNDPVEIKAANDELRRALDQYFYRANKVDPEIAKGLNTKNNKLNSYERMTGLLDDYYNVEKQADKVQAFADAVNEKEGLDILADNNKVMAEDIGIDNTPEPQSVKGTFEIPDTPENAPTGPRPETTEDLWNQLENAGKEQTTAPSPENVAPRTQEINEQGKKLSRLHGTLQNTDKLTDAEKQTFADKNGFWYDPDKEKELADGVKAEIEANGLDSIYNKYADADLDYSKLSGIDSHRLHTAAFDYSRLGTEAMQNGDKDLASFYNAKARALELKAREIGTAGGQFNAATAYYARTPEGAVNKAYEILDDQIKDFKAKNPKLTDSIDELSNLISKRLKDVDVDSIMTGTDEAAKADLRKQVMDGLEDYLGKSKNKAIKNALDGLSDKEIDQIIADKYAKDIAKTLDMFSMGSFGVKQETIDQVLDIFEEAQQYGINSKEYYKLEKKAYTLLANDLMNGKSFADKFNTWRYFAMLSNPLTHIRNNLGNLTNGGLVGIKNNLAAAIEAGAERAAKAQGKSGIQGGRTKSVLNLATDKDLIEGAAKDFDDEGYRLYKQGGSKWINVGDDIEAAAHAWKNKGAGKVLNTLTEGNSKALDVEDIIAGKAKYQTSMAGFLKANGADASIFTKTDDASRELLDQARTYALNQANEATFHQNSKLAKYFTEHFNGKIGNVVIPFKKTPANILQASFEYSPAMFLHVARETNAWKKGAITTAQYIDDISKGVVGSVGLGIGALLAHEGILSVSSGNEKEDAFNKKRGQQTLALKIGGKYFNIGDLAPASMPLVVGASIYDTYKNSKSGGDAALDSILNGLGTISNTVTDMTMLSGLADFVSAARYAESNADVGLSLAENVVGNLASQMLPTVGGKIEKTIDDTKRTTYTDKTGKLAKYVDQERRYLQTKIPALQEIGEKMEKSDNQTIAKLGDAFTLEPQIDGWGNEMKVEDYGIGTGGRAITNFVNPITTTTDTSDRLDEELRQIYKDNKNDENVLKFGQNSSSEAKVGDEKMTDKQWTEYQKANGKMKHDLGMSFIDSEAYKSMSAADKASALSTMGDFAKAYNQNKITGKEMSSANQKLAEIYESAGGGKKGAEAVASEAAAKSFAKDTGFSSSSNAAKAIQEDVKNGDLDAANEKKEAAKTIQDYGLTKPGPSYTYYNAQEKIPSLTPEEFSNTYKAIDSNGNQGITQDELINYLNKSNISEAEGKKIWSAYGSSNWKAIPKLEDGTWKKGK